MALSPKDVKFFTKKPNNRAGTYRRGKAMVNDMFLSLVADGGKFIVPEITEEEGLMNSTVNACVNIITSDIARLPINVVKVRVDAAGNETFTVVRKHPISALLRRKPNKHQNRADFMRQVVSNLVLHGASLVTIERDGGGKIKELIPLSNSDWEPELLDNGEMVFHIREANGEIVPRPYSDVMYFKSPIQTQGWKSYSPLQCARKSVQIDNGYGKVQNNLTKHGRPNGVWFMQPFATPQEEAAADRALNERFGPDGQGGSPIVTGDDVRYQVIDPKSVDMELVAAKKAQVEEIAKFFRVPVEKLLHGTKSYASATVTAQEYAREALTPHIDAIEAEMTRAFFGTDEAWIIDIDDADLLRGSNLEQAQYLMTLLGPPGGRGAITQNELRYELGRPRSDDPEADRLSMGSSPTVLESEIEKEVQRRLAATKGE